MRGAEGTSAGEQALCDLPTRAFALSLYRTMLLIRLCEEAFVDPIRNREIWCPVHLYSGEEAVATGVCAALSREDYVLGTHRSHGHYLAKGGDLTAMVAEIFCRETGCAGGRGGSMHILDPRAGMLGAAPIVSGTIPLAVGAALASVVRGQPHVSVCFFGDGATGEGTLYESMNLAALRNLPVLFVCENNLYSTHLPVRECRVHEDVFRIAEPFGIPSSQVDGNDVLAVHAAAARAVARARRGGGPSFLECLTYRLRGHVGPDDNVQGSRTDIRPPEEIAAWRRRDPLPRFEMVLLERGLARASDIDDVRKAARREVEASFALARASAFPTPSRDAVHG